MSNLNLSGEDYTKLEISRNQLAKAKKFKELEKTYQPAMLLVNPNTNTFWNKKISLSKIDPDNVTKRRIETVNKMIPSKTKSMLDIGIGYGYLEDLINKNNRVIKITGVDISEEAIKKLRKKFKFKLLVANVEKLSNNLGKYELVVAMELFEHIFPNKVFLVMNKIKKFLQNKGLLIISVPLLFNNNNLDLVFPYDSSNHVRLYSKELIIAELNIAGFVVEEVKEIYAYPNFYFLRNVINKLINRWKPNILVIKASVK